MNQRDLENVYFLLNADKKTIEDWYSKTTHDDHEYACEIMKAYQEELLVKLELLKIDNFKVQDTQIASSVLERYRI